MTVAAPGLGGHATSRRCLLVLVLALLVLVAPVSVLRSPGASVSAATTPTLPFDLPASATLRSSPKKVFAHWVPPTPISLDNQPPATDYYARNYLNPDGEAGKHSAYGGYLRDRPLPRDPRPESTWRLLDMETEVRQAISAGLDGFTMVIYSVPGDPDLQQWTNAKLMMQAAVNVDPGFKIILQPDMSRGLKTKDQAALAKPIAELGAYSSAYRLGDGRLVVSPFIAENHPADWWKLWMDVMSASYGLPVAFLPLFLNEQPYLTSFAPISYGMSNWGNRNPLGNDPTLTHSTSPMGRIAKVRALGLKWMQPVSTQDARPREGIFDEGENTTNLRNTWQIAIDSGSELVQLATWGDYPESSQMAPSVKHGWTFLDISSYYLTKFKTGTAPTIARDAVYLTHRGHALAARPTYPQTLLMSLRGGSPARDTVEALTFAASPATVRVTVGSTTYVCAVAAGVDSCVVPLGTGTVRAQVVRNSATVAALTSPYVVTATPYVQDLQYVGSGSLRQGGAAPAPASPTVATAVAKVVAVAPTADTYANAGVPAGNYGTSASLSARGNVGAMSYLRFVMPVAPVGTTMSSAVLRLRTNTDPTAGSTEAYTVQSAADSWTETGLTWNNRPALTPGALATIAGGTKPETVYGVALPVATIKSMAGTQRTFAITGTGTDNIWFWSRNFATPSYRPVLVLSYLPDAAAPSVPSGLAGTASATSTNLSWAASTDTTGVVGYDVYRSTVSGAAPSAATLVASVAGTTFTGATPAGGPWYYRVVAKDAAGNRSAASGQAQPTPDVQPSTLVALTPTADSYANAGAPTSNFGTSWTLLSRGTLGGTSYLRFVMPAAPTGKSLTGAVLNIRTTTESGAGSSQAHTVQSAPDTWSESTLSWVNRPAPSGVALGTLAGGAAPETVATATLNLTSMQGMLGRQVTLAVTSVGTDSLLFWSRHHGSASARPTLQLTFK